MTRTAPVVVVVVPARDEQTEIADCVEHLQRAADRAVDHGAAAQVRLVVLAHRCADRTAERAVAALRDGVLVVDDHSASLGQVRDLGVRRGLDRGDDPSTTWILSTDADSRVPEDWVIAALRETDRTGARVVLGTTTLRPSALPEPVLARYDAHIASERRDGVHDHVYGANLAIRLDAYDAVGGFPHLEADEDVGLVRLCREHGIAVTTPISWSVATSARTTGRTTKGLARTLRRLVEQETA